MIFPVSIHPLILSTCDTFTYMCKNTVITVNGNYTKVSKQNNTSINCTKLVKSEKQWWHHGKVRQQTLTINSILISLPHIKL